MKPCRTEVFTSNAAVETTARHFRTSVQPACLASFENDQNRYLLRDGGATSEDVAARECLDETFNVITRL